MAEAKQKLKRISAGIQPATWKKAKALAKTAGVSLMEYVSDAVEQRIAALERDRNRRLAKKSPVLE